MVFSDSDSNPEINEPIVDLDGIETINNGPSPGITISNTGPVTEGSNVVSDGQTINEDITFTFEDANGAEVSMFELSEAEINIFDSDYYINSNPDIADDINSEYQNASTRLNLIDVNLPEIAPLGSTQIQSGGDYTITIGSNTITDDTLSITQYSSAIEDYVTGGAAEGRDPSPLFNSEYYLEQNPDVATAIAGGDFRGDPLFHYVETGATEGRDPNPFFDSDYYLEQNPGVVETGLNPLEHYVLLGSSSGADPSANFDPDFYLNQNQDVANAGIDPLTHFLTAGQEEGRLPIAE